MVNNKKRPKSDYINNAQIDTIVAFKINDVKAFSGKIKGITEKQFIVETKNGIRFNVDKSKVIWVKTGKRWPKGVYNMLKGLGNGNGK